MTEAFVCLRSLSDVCTHRLLRPHSPFLCVCAPTSKQYRRAGRPFISVPATTLARLVRVCDRHFCNKYFSTVVMPSKRELCLVAKSDLQREFLARDVEELVSEIKENLRLKARPRRTQAQRPSPYKVERPPQRPEPPASTEDPYEMLQQLLESNSLVAEAVRRLQEGLGPKQRFLYDEEDEVALLTCPISI